MANAFGSITSTVALLKNWYEGPVVSEFNDAVPLYREMEKGKEKYNGLQVVRSVKVRRNPGIGSTSDGGLLPKIGTQGTVNANIPAKFNYLRFGITGPMMKAASGNNMGSFVNAVEFEMKEGLTDLKNDVNRQLFWNGNGQIGTVAANAVASNVITATGRESTEAGNKFLDVGIVIDIYDSTGVTQKAANVEITAITGTTTVTLTLSAPVTVSATDIIVRQGSLNNDIQGLLYTLDGLTTTIYGVDRSTFPRFRGNVVDLSGGQLTLDALQQTFNAGKEIGGANYSAILCDYDTERFYNKLLVADRRYVSAGSTKVVGDGTFSKKDQSYLEYAGMPVVPDKDCPRRFFFLSMENWKKYVLAELEWADETGSYMLAQISSDAFEARLRLFANAFCEKPTAQAVLRNYISP